MSIETGVALALAAAGWIYNSRRPAALSARDKERALDVRGLHLSRTGSDSPGEAQGVTAAAARREESDLAWREASAASAAAGGSYEPEGMAPPSSSGAYLLSELTGEAVPREDFLPSGTMPFFSGSLKGPSPDRENYLNERRGYAGPPAGVPVRKSENGPRFGLVANSRQALGDPDPRDSSASRLQDSFSDYRANQLPFEQVRVGPGLDDGYTGRPSGGVHQASTRDYAMPRSIDELRTADNPRTVLPGVMIPGRGINVERSLGPQSVDKNRPETAFPNWREPLPTSFSGPGAPTGRPAFETNRGAGGRYEMPTPALTGAYSDGGAKGGYSRYGYEARPPADHDARSAPAPFMGGSLPGLGRPRLDDEHLSYSLPNNNRSAAAREGFADGGFAYPRETAHRARDVFQGPPGYSGVSPAHGSVPSLQSDRGAGDRRAYAQAGPPPMNLAGGPSRGPANGPDTFEARQTLREVGTCLPLFGPGNKAPATAAPLDGAGLVRSTVRAASGCEAGEYGARTVVNASVPGEGYGYAHAPDAGPATLRDTVVENARELMPTAPSMGVSTGNYASREGLGARPTAREITGQMPVFVGTCASQFNPEGAYEQSVRMARDTLETSRTESSVRPGTAGFAGPQVPPVRGAEADAASRTNLDREMIAVSGARFPTAGSAVSQQTPAAGALGDDVRSPHSLLGHRDNDLPRATAPPPGSAADEAAVPSVSLRREHGDPGGLHGATPDPSAAAWALQNPLALKPFSHADARAWGPGPAGPAAPSGAGPGDGSADVDRSMVPG
jgi:hypothetical protein